MLDLPFCTVKLATMALTPEQLADIRTRIPARPETDIPMPYEDLVRKILTEGTLKSDRTGTGTVSLFGQQMRFDLSEYFPLLTTKTVFFKGLAYELLWFLKGSTNVRWLQERNVHIWDEWADENGDLGPVYGAQWRSWPAPTPDDPNRTIDQISNVLDLVENHPDSRRMVVSAWILPKWRIWRCRHATRSSSSTWRMANFRASYISVPATCSSAYRSISHPIRC